MDRKKSPREIIENVNNPHFEEAWIKFPGEEIKSISRVRYRERVEGNYRCKKNHTLIHTHTFTETYEKYPGKTDFFQFLSLPIQRSMVVAQTNPETGKLIGYYIVRKTKLAPKIGLLEKAIGFIEGQINEISFGLYNGIGIQMNINNLVRTKDELERKESTEKFMKKYHLQHRYVPVKSDYLLFSQEN